MREITGQFHLCDGVEELQKTGRIARWGSDGERLTSLPAADLDQPMGRPDEFDDV